MGVSICTAGIMKIVLTCFVILALCTLSMAERRKGKRHHRKPDPAFVKAEEDTWTMWDTAKQNKIPASKVGESIASTPAKQLVNFTLHPSTIQIHMDDDLDGYVSRKEFHRWLKDIHSLKKRVDRDWDRADINEDGSMTLREYMASPMGRYARRKAGKKAAEAEFKRMDRSGKSLVTKEDFFWYVSSDDFGSADRNKDGFITLEEYMKAPFHFHDYDEPTPKQIKKEFEESDLNKDGKMSLEEFNTQLKLAREEDRKRDLEDERDGRDGDDDEDDRQRPHQVKAKKAVTQLNN